jgi:hypothetical protein
LGNLLFLSRLVTLITEQPAQQRAKIRMTDFLPSEIVFSFGNRKKVIQSINSAIQTTTLDVVSYFKARNRRPGFTFGLTNDPISEKNHHQTSMQPNLSSGNLHHPFRII